MVPAGARFCPACGHPTTGPIDERRVVTVLFADIVGFTTLSETMDPERVKRLVDGWFERLVADITAFGGRVDKIVGDGILALFGAPVAHEDDAERAVRAALRMQDTLAAISARTATGGEASPRVQMRIGVNTGEVLVGALRAGGATTAMGDVVNTASRLQTAARPGEVLVGPTTHSATAHCIDFQHRGLLTARGRDAPVEAWAATRALLPPGQRPARHEAPLVGRNRELGLVDAAVGAALGHQRALVGIVVGDTGVGKTRLVREAAERMAAGRDVLLLDGRCVPYGEANVWWPLAEALYAHCELEASADHDEVHAAVWARVAAALGDECPDEDLDRVAVGLLTLMGRDPALDSRDPARAREAAVDAFVDFLEGHARRRPVILLLSDIHWADDDLLELIETLLVRLARCPVVVLATARQAVRDRWNPPPGRHDTFVLNLDPLDQAAAEELLTSLHGDTVPDALRADILNRSGGNPFFLEELVALVDCDGDHALRPGLPDTLRGIVAARLDALGPTERAVLTDAAVIGRRGPVVALREMSRALHREADIDAVLATLVATELLEVDTGYWGFRSEIAREVAYATLPKAERAKRHAGIAAWIEERLLEDVSLDLDDPRAEELVATSPDVDDATVNRLAHHWAAAAEVEVEMGDLASVPARARDRAVCWLTASARRAQRRDVLAAAERGYDRAIQLAGPEPVARRVRLLVARARVRSDRWDLAGAREDAEAALSGATATGDRSVEAAAVLRLGEIEQRTGDTDAAAARLRHAADRFAAESDDRGRGEALRLLGLSHMFAGELDAARSALAEAEEAFVRAGDPAGQGWVAQNLAWVGMLVGDVAATEAQVDRALALFGEVDEIVGRAWARGLLAFVRFAQGRREEAQQLADEILDVTGAQEDKWATAMMRGLVGSLRLWAGDVTDALTHTAVATQSFRDLGDPWGLAVSLATHGRALAMSGRVDAGFAAVRESATVGRGPGRGGVGDIATVALAVQVGEPERAALALAQVRGQADATLGAIEADATFALAALQEGQRPEVPATGGRAFGYAAAAVVAAGRGELDAALAAADAVPGCDEATYLDRALAEVAAGLALVRAERADEGWPRLAAAREAVAATDDRVGQAVVGLASAVAAEAAGRPDAVAERSAAAIALARIGLVAGGWETAFRQAAGIAVSAATA
ncbi:AAA family ATPase [Iamia sp. SCSIO 61187]|nr:AAA family ATPase [Iamia sp. SCSIO 61187]